MLEKCTINYFLNRSVLHLGISKVLVFLMFRTTQFVPSFTKFGKLSFCKRIII